VLPRAVDADGGGVGRQIGCGIGHRDEWYREDRRLERVRGRRLTRMHAD
jgi:hypothetical protein